MTDASEPAAVAAAPVTDVASTPRAKPAKHVWANLSNPLAVGFSLTLGGLLAFALGIAFSNLSTIIIYVVFALFAALGLDPVVRWFERHHVKRVWGIVIVYTAFALVLVGILFLIIPTVVTQITEFIDNVPSTISDFQKTSFYTWLSGMFGGDITGTLTTQIQKFLSNPANIAAVGGGLLKLGLSIATGISGIVIVIVLSLYFLASIPAMKGAFNRLLPARNREFAAGMTDQITDSIGAYLMGMVVLALINSVVATILHVVLGLPYALLMGVVAFLVTLIPLVGSVLYWIVGSAIALFTNPVAALIFAIVYLIYMQLEAYVLTPRVMSRAIAVPGALVVIGALVGGTLLGLLGALVAIPVTASILLIIKQIAIPRQDAKV